MDYNQMPDNNNNNGYNNNYNNNNDFNNNGDFNNNYNYNNDYNNNGGQNNGGNGFAIASLVLGIISIPMGCCYGVGILLAILSIIFGIISRKNSYGKLSGMALAGIICSIFGILFSVLMIVLMVVAYTSYDSSTYNDILQQYSNYY